MEKVSKVIVCYGEVLWDILPDGPQPGGAPFNVCYHLNKLGLAGKMIGRVGADKNGIAIIQIMNKAGIATDLIQTDSNNHTGKVLASIDSSEEVSYKILSPVAWDFTVFDDRQFAFVQSGSYFVYGSLCARGEVSRHTLYELLKTDACKVFDVNLRAPHFTPSVLYTLLKRVDIVKCNADELKTLNGLFGGPETFDEQANFLMKQVYLRELVVTNGSVGAAYFKGNKKFTTTTPKITVNDTIGSGDSFLAAFISGHFADAHPQEILENAAAMGAFVAARKGGCPEYTLAEYENFLNQQIHYTPLNLN